MKNTKRVLSPVAQIYSHYNQFCFSLRKYLAFSKDGYSEQLFTAEDWQAWLSDLPDAVQKIIFSFEQKYQIQRWKDFLSLSVVQKNIHTLWLLESVMDESLAGLSEVLDVGCANFDRAAAMAAFWRKKSPNTKIIGLELDAFICFQNKFTQADQAQYYCGQIENIEFIDTDFFSWRRQQSVIVCFFPLITPEATLAWSLPVKYGRIDAWLDSIVSNLSTNGLALLYHQGPREEMIFDRARQSYPALELIKRRQLKCPFYDTPYITHASLYRKNR